MANLGSWVSISGPCLVSFALILVIGSERVAAVYGNDADDVGGRGSLICRSDNLAEFLPDPYNNLSDLVCKTVWNTYTLRYSQSKENVLTIILSTVYTTGWVGMGFSKDGLMVGASTMVGWVSKEGHGKIKQYYVEEATVAGVVPDKGELPLTGIPTVVALHDASIYLAFQLKYNKPVATQPILLAYGSRTPPHERLSPHDDKTTVIFDFSKGSVSSNRAEVMGKRKGFHGIMGALGWGLILPVGTIIARHLRHKDPLWYYLHTVLQFTGLLLIIANLVTGQLLFSGKIPDQRVHRSIGIFAFVLCIIQVMAFFLRPNREAKIRRYWNWYHNWFGRIALFFGSINIVLGMQLGGVTSDWKLVYGIILGTILMTVIILEALSILRRLECPKPPPPPPSFQLDPI